MAEQDVRKSLSYYHSANQLRFDRDRLESQRAPPARQATSAAAMCGST